MSNSPVKERVAATDFAEILANHMPYMRQCAAKYTRDWDKAKDLAQDIFIHALEHQHQFESGTNLKGWLSRMTHNLFVNQHRRNNRYSFVDISDSLYDTGTLRNSEYNEAGSGLDVKLIEHGISKLPEKIQRSVVLRSEGHDYDSIADELNIPVGSVRSALHRGRKLLSDYLDNPTYDVLQTAEPQSKNLPEDKNIPYDRVLTWLLESVPTNSFIEIDKRKLTSLCGVPPSSVGTLLVILCESGALLHSDTRPYRYKRTNVLESLTGKRVRFDVVERIAGRTFPVPVLPKKIERSASPMQPTRKVKADVPVNPVRPLNKKAEYGYADADGVVWVGDYDEAIRQASQKVIGGSAGVELIQRIGHFTIHPQLVTY